MSNKPEKVRLQFDFSPADMKRLDEIKDSTGSTTRAEVMRNAIRAYDYLLSLDPDDIVEISDGQGKVVFRGKAKLIR